MPYSLTNLGPFLFGGSHKKKKLRVLCKFPHHPSYKTQCTALATSYNARTRSFGLSEWNSSEFKMYPVCMSQEHLVLPCWSQELGAYWSRNQPVKEATHLNKIQTQKCRLEERLRKRVREEGGRERVGQPWTPSSVVEWKSFHFWRK